MSNARIRVSLIACALLGAVTSAAYGQPAPPPGFGGPSATAEDPATALAPPGALPPAPPVVTTPSEVVEVTAASEIARCRELGDAYADTAIVGDAGRTGLRAALRSAARMRGASHVRYSGHVTLVDSGVQRERGQFYDCRVRLTPAVATAPGLAVAGGAPGQDARVTADDPAAPRLGVAFTGHAELVPSGTLSGRSGAVPQQRSAITALGASATIENVVSPVLALGFHPGMVFGLQSAGNEQPATQVDLQVRARFGKLSGAGLGVYGFVTAGLSWLVLPDEDAADGGIVGFGAGGSYPVTRSSFLTFEIGYRIGFQSRTDRFAGGDVDLSTRLVHIGFGLGAFL